MYISKVYDQLLAYTIKMSSVEYIKKIHCVDTITEFAGDGISIPLAYVGTESNTPMYATILDYFTDDIVNKVIHTTMPHDGCPIIVVCTISRKTGNLITRIAITSDQIMEIPAYEPTYQMYSLPYKDVGTLFKN